MTYLENLKYCNEYLLSVMLEMRKQAADFPKDTKNQRALMRSLMNICPPTRLTVEYYAAQDAVLSADVVAKGIVGIDDMQEYEHNIYLWKGDITRLNVGAIVNAANSKMLGCFVPMHGCIDNAIHSASGMQLRNECAAIMDIQDDLEPAGEAKITKAYNLPSTSIIHTVGPIVFGGLTKRHCELLASSYEKSYMLAVENNLECIAFCCISTGEFRFPNDDAAKIAVDTIRKLNQKHDLKVIFNVFKEEDYKIYDELLKQAKIST